MAEGDPVVFEDKVYGDFHRAYKLRLDTERAARTAPAPRQAAAAPPQDDSPDPITKLAAALIVTTWVNRKPDATADMSLPDAVLLVKSVAKKLSEQPSERAEEEES